MRILLTNDDGIRAPGIAAMHGALAAGNEILVVAPLTVQSAAGHGVTFKEPLMTSREQVRDNPVVTGIAVDGRPADCVKLAISSLWPEQFGAGSRPDLVVSGMNAGANVGINVIYSGTIAAAIEAAFLGVPAIAVSLMLGKGRPLFDVAAGWAHRAIEAMITGGLPAPHEVLSVNIPVTERDGPVPAVRVCPMNTHGLVDAYQKRTSPAGDAYYWPSGQGLDFHATEPGTDVDALMAGNITVTPLMYDLTAHAAMEKWRGRAGRPGPVR